MKLVSSFYSQWNISENESGQTYGKNKTRKRNPQTFSAHISCNIMLSSLAQLFTWWNHIYAEITTKYEYIFFSDSYECLLTKIYFCWVPLSKFVTEWLILFKYIWDEIWPYCRRKNSFYWFIICTYSNVCHISLVIL